MSKNFVKCRHILCIFKSDITQRCFADSNFPEWTKGSRGITVPLSFPEKESSPFLDKDRIMLCLLCEEKFEHPQRKDEFLVHLTCEHRFIIANVEMISDLPSYIGKFILSNLNTKIYRWRR